MLNRKSETRESQHSIRFLKNNNLTVNLLSANSRKWANTLKQFVGNSTLN